MEKRIIPCLDLKDGKVVKGVNFVDLKEIGDPVQLAKKYEEQGASELAALDISATNEGRETSLEVIRHICEQVTIPVTVGGGIRTIEGIEKLFQTGVTKVSIASAAVEREDFIREVVQQFGGARIVIAVDVKKDAEGKWSVMIKGGKEDSGREAVSFCKTMAKLGVGEILLTSMETDGKQEGYEIGLLKQIKEVIDIPVIASGGCGNLEHIIQVFREKAADAALVASVLHYEKLTVADIRQGLKEQGMA